MNNKMKITSKKLTDSHVANLMRKFPPEIAHSFNEKQRKSIVEVMDAHFSKTHSLDLRGTFPVPFYPARIYYVLLFGRDVRELSRHEASIALATLLLMIIIFLTVCIALGLLIIYLLKSALGINIFENHSLGIWGWLVGS